MELLPLWKKREVKTDLYDFIFVACENDEQVNAFCNRLDEFIEQADDLSERIKADFILDFDHELTRIKRFTIESVSKFTHDRLIDTLTQLRKVITVSDTNYTSDTNTTSDTENTI